MLIKGLVRESVLILRLTRESVLILGLARESVLILGLAREVYVFQETCKRFLFIRGSPVSLC